MYNVELTQRSERFLAKLFKSQSRMAARVSHAIDRLAEDPQLGVALRGELKGCYKYRVGTYRIIYQTVRKRLTIIIIDIGHRKEIYR